MRWFVLFFLLRMPGWAIAQPEENGTAVFNSIELEEVTYDGFSITSGYYSLADNIDNQQSVAFISNAPSVDEYLYFARHQPSYYFLVHYQRKVVRMVVFQQQIRSDRSQFYYTIIDPESGDHTEVPSQLSGEITQLRAKELVMSHADPLAQFARDSAAFSFNGASYAVQPLKAVRQEVVALIRELLREDRSQTEELEEYIRAETVGGTLDFSIALAKEAQEYFSRGGMSYGKELFSVLLWGGAVRMLGVRSVDSALALWEEIQRRPLTLPESRALRRGFTEEHPARRSSERR